MYISLKGLEKGRPVGRSDLSISNTRFFQPLFWLHNSRQVPLALHMGDHFPAFLIPGINQPGLVALLANKCPEFIHLQRLIMCAFGTGLMRAAQGCQNLAAAVAGDGADVAYAAAAGSHLSDQLVCTGMAAQVVEVVVADKLPAAVLAAVLDFLPNHNLHDNPTKSQTSRAVVCCPHLNPPPQGEGTHWLQNGFITPYTIWQMLFESAAERLPPPWGRAGAGIQIPKNVCLCLVWKEA